MPAITLAQALSSGTGRERTFSCPAHADDHPSASVNVAKGVWYCYSCHSSGSVDGAVYDAVEPETLLRELTAMLAEPEHGFYAESWLDQFDGAGPGEYWLSRFEPSTCAAFRLGHDPVRDAATYPLRDPAGRLLGVVRRDLSGAGAKYRYPRGVRTASLLFNYSPEQISDVVLVEGATDAIAAHEAGIAAFACFTNRVSAAQLALIERIAPARIVAAFDDDPAGRAGAEALRVVVGSAYPLARATFGGAKDLAELPPQRRRASIEQAVAL